MPLSFSDQIRNALENDEESYSAISKATGIPQPNLSRFVLNKNGNSGLTMNSLDILAEYLGLQIVVKRKKSKNRKAGK